MSSPTPHHLILINYVVDINLSITMTFVSTVAALGMMPLWIFLMAPLLTEVWPKYALKGL